MSEAEARWHESPNKRNSWRLLFAGYSALALAVAGALVSLSPDPAAWQDSVLYGPALERVCDLTPTAPGTGWPGALLDARVHASPDEAGQEAFARDLLTDMNAAGVSRVVVAGFGAESGLDRDALRALEARWAPIARSCDRLRFQLSGVDLDEADPSAWVASMLERGPFAGISVDLSQADLRSRKLERLYSLLETRGLPLQFQGPAQPSDEFLEAVRWLAAGWPTLPLVWFGCPADMDWAEQPQNLSCSLPVSGPLCEGECSSRELARLDRSMLGSGPVEGSAGLAGAAVGVRSALSELPTDTASSLAAQRWLRVFGGGPPDELAPAAEVALAAKRGL